LGFRWGLVSLLLPTRVNAPPVLGLQERAYALAATTTKIKAPVR